MTIFPAFLSLGLLLANIGLPIKHQPDPAGQAVVKADALRTQDKHQEAVDTYDEALRLDPNNSDAYLGRAASHEALRQPERAEEDYALAIRAAPRSYKPWATRAKARAEMARSEEAEADYDIAIGLDPYDDDLYLERGDVRQDRGRYELAVADFTRALALTLKESSVVAASYVNRCKAFRKLKRYDEALADIERARQAGTDDPEQRVGLSGPPQTVQGGAGSV